MNQTLIDLDWAIAHLKCNVNTSKLELCGWQFQTVDDLIAVFIYHVCLHISLRQPGH